MTRNSPRGRFADHPEHRQLTTRLGELDTARAAVRARLEAVRIALTQEGDPATSVGGARAQRASALLAGHLPQPAPDRSQLRDECVRLQQESADLDEAVRMGRIELERLESKLSPRIAAQRKPEHLALVSRIAELLAELGHALAAEETLRDDLEQEGVRYLSTIRPMGLPMLGAVRDRQSLLRQYLAEAAEYGAKVPKVSDTSVEPYRPKGNLAMAASMPAARTEEADDGWTPAA